jgi:hypothetical protein
MKAVSYESKETMAVSSRAKPKSNAPTDALLRVTTNRKRYNEYLRDLIIAGNAHSGKIVSHRISIDDVPEACKKFDKRIERYTKVLIRMRQPAASSAASA